MSQAVCPQCQVPLDVGAMTEGKVPCPSCQSWFVLPNGSSETQPQSFQPIVTNGNHGGESLEQGPAKWLPFVAGAIVVVVSGILAFVVWLAVKSENGVAQTDTSNTELSDVDESTAPPPEVEGVLDLSELDALDSLETSNVPSTTNASEELLDRNQFGWPANVKLFRIPAGEISSLDGIVQTAISTSGLSNQSLLLPVPAGTHKWKASAKQEPVMISSEGFSQYYHSEQERFSGVEGLDVEKLFQEFIKSNGVCDDPIIGHLIGNAYWQIGEPGAATRFWRLVVGRFPEFAPSHLNLAYAEFEKGNSNVAARELYLASVLNLQDTFAIARHLSALRRHMGNPSESTYRFRHQDYLPDTSNHAKTQELINVYSTLKDLARAPSDQAACLNNIGVYLMEKRNSPGAAYSYFMRAHQIIGRANESETHQVASTVLDNLVRSTEAAGFPESVLFKRLLEKRE